MAKIKKTDINKLSKLDQQIEELKKQKKEQEEQVSKNIGSYILSKIDIDDSNSVDELYNVIDKVIENFNNSHIEENSNNELNDTKELNESNNEENNY